MATNTKYFFLLASLVVVLGLLSTSSSAYGFEFNGTVLMPNMSGANGTNVTVTIIGNLSNPQGLHRAWSWSAITNSSGYFNFSFINDTNNSIYQISMKKHSGGALAAAAWTNISANYTGSIFAPCGKEAIVNELSNSTFYLTPAVNINITTGNETLNTWVAHNGMIIDEKLGVIVDTWRGSNSNTSVGTFNNGSTFNTKWSNFLIGNESQHWAVLPADRNYTVVVWTAYAWNETNIALDANWNTTRGSPPRVIRITNTSNYFVGESEARTITLDLNLTTDRITGTESGQHQVPGLYSVNGTVKIYPGYSSNSQLNYTRVVAYPYIREAGNLTLYDVPILNCTGFDENINSSNFQNGWFNISLLGGQEYILAAFANDSATTYYAGFTNLSVNKSNIGNSTQNITIYVKPIAGSFYANNETGPVNTSMTVFQFINGDTNTTLNDTVKVKVNAVYNGTEMNWVTMTNHTAAFSMPLWNGTAVDVTAYSTRYAPRTYRVTAAQIDARQHINISLYNFRLEDPDTDQATTPGTIQYLISNASCNLPKPIPACNLTSLDSVDFGAWQQAETLYINNKSLRITLSGIIVHYVDFDSSVSGAPEAAFDASATTLTSGDNYYSTWKIGSKAPEELYDWVLVGIPYDTTYYNEDGVFNVTLSNLYDDAWTGVWDTAEQGRLAANNLADFDDYNQTWFTGMNCDRNIDTRINTTQSCFLNTTSNYIWLNLPHFSGVAVKLKGVAVEGAAAAATTGGTSGGGAAAGADSTSTYWASVEAGEETTMSVIGIPALAASSISFTLSESATEVRLTATALTAKPTSIPAGPSGTVYSYFDVDATGIEETQVSAATIAFKVEKTWISENNVKQDTIKLARYTDQWDVLNTRKVDEDTTYLHFEANTPGFSTFAIIAETLAGEEIIAPLEGVLPGLPTLEELQAELQKPANLGLLAALVIVLIGVGYIFTRKKRPVYARAARRRTRRRRR